jgi:hypothetical protein
MDEEEWESFGGGWKGFWNGEIGEIIEVIKLHYLSNFINNKI